jgi:TatD DNase family protein
VNSVLVDTHCHLDPTYYPQGEREALEEARAAGVSGFVVIGVGETLEPARHALAIAAREPGVAATVGVHPHDASRLDDAMRDALIDLAASPLIVAIGEIGLDYHDLHSPKETQLRVFRELCQVARRLRKPIVVHTREAPEDTLVVLEEEGARDVGGIIHCFSEDLAFARRALDLDFDLSFSGVVTFKNARSVHEVAAWAPADRILVETDSPYLAPVPFRGKPCRPSMVVHTAQRVAELRGVDRETIAATTTANAERRLRFGFRGST